MEKKLGKIENISFGYGGYQDCMLGLSVTLGNGEWGVQDFKGNWDAESIKVTEYTQWTETDRDRDYSNLVRFISKLLKQAKVSNIEQLKGKPVEVTFDSNLLKEWRILTEVL
jgi:hypothetical protein